MSGFRQTAPKAVCGIGVRAAAAKYVPEKCLGILELLGVECGAFLGIEERRGGGMGEIDVADCDVGEGVTSEVLIQCLDFFEGVFRIFQAIWFLQAGRKHVW